MIALTVNAGEPQMPQMRITYNSGSLNYNSYIPGTVELTDTDGSVVTLNATFKTRGATARQYSQKPALNMKLKDEDGNELDTDLLGLRKASSFILDAMAIDRINMRNRVAFDIWNSFSRLPYETDFGSRNGTVGRFVEMYINDKYKGIYCVSDKVNRKLLDLKKPQVDENTGDVTIRGVLYKNGTNDIGNQNTAGFFNDSTVYVARYHDAWELHEPEDYPGGAAWAPLVDFYNGNTSNYAYVKENFNLENLADYTIHIMALCIADNWGAKNRYFSIQNITRTDEKGKFIITPWDLDTSLGGNYKGDRYDGNYSEWSMSEITKNPPVPLTACMSQPEFKALLKKRWIDGRSGAFAPDSVKLRMQEYADLFIGSGAWERTVNANNSHDLTVKDLQKEITLIGEWYEKRFGDMDKYFNVTAEDISGVAFTPAEEKENAIYTLQGIRIKEIEHPGIYIVNGKKVRLSLR